MLSDKTSKRGRPKIDDPKRKIFKLRMSDDDFAKLEEVSQFLGISKTEVMLLGFDHICKVAKYNPQNI